MNKVLLKNFKSINDWQNIPKEDFYKLGILDDESMSCLGAYIYKYSPNNLVYLHNYGADFNEFLDEYLGMLYDNDSDGFLPSPVKQKLNINSKLNSIYLNNHNILNKRCLINIFKIVSPDNLGFCAQIFFHNQNELIAFNALIPYLDSTNPFKSLELTSPHVFQLFNEITGFLKK